MLIPVARPAAFNKHLVAVVEEDLVGAAEGEEVGATLGSRNVGTTNGWEITGLNNSRMMVHPAYCFIDEQWSNIPEQEVQQQLLQMRREYQQQKRQRTIPGGDQVSYVSQVSHYQPVPGIIHYALPPSVDYSVVPPPPPRL